MKLVNSRMFKTGLSLVLLGSALTVNADPKKEVIEHQQKTNSVEMDAAQKARPAVESRPAVTTQKTLDSTFKESSLPDPKKVLIKQQQQSTRDEINAVKKAKPAVEGRPAVTTKKTLKAVESGS